MARLHLDSDQETEILWYPAQPKAGTLPFPSGVLNIDWETDPHLKTGIGEVVTAPRRYSSKKAIPGALGGHICGTREEHLRGELLDTSRAPNQYQPNGLPVCCGGDVLLEFELALQVTLEVEILAGTSATGGMGAGGEAPTATGRIGDATGGVGFGGAGEVVAGVEHVPAGGAGIGGAGVLGEGVSYTPDGGAGFGGAGVLGEGVSYTPDGGAGVGGGALVVIGAEHVPTGGAGFGGAGEVVAGVEHVPTGGAGFGGAGVLGEGVSYTPDGGAGFGGTATVVAEVEIGPPPPPPPGP